MDTFKELFMNVSGEEIKTELPLYKEMAIDFTTGELITKDNEIIQLEGAESLKVWIWRALKTPLMKYRIHSQDYGNELHKEIGYVYNRTIKEQLLYNEIKTCLSVNPYIVSVSNFSTVANDDAGQQITISFECETIYGNISMQREVLA